MSGEIIYPEEDIEEGPELLNVSSRYKKPPSHPTRSGRVFCLNCGTAFISWDRTRNRLCPSCAARRW